MSVPEAELVASPVIGYRCWHVDRGMLWSLGGWPERGCGILSKVRRVAWPPLGAEAMPCRKGLSPVLECQCGLYATVELSQALSQKTFPTGKQAHRPDPESLAVGAVVLWGRVIENELVRRAQYARPVALLDAGGARLVAAAYGVPLMSEAELQALDSPHAHDERTSG